MDIAQEICSRIDMVKKYLWRKKMFTGKINLELKTRIMKCLVWSVCSTVCSRDVDVDADRQKKKIRSL